MNWSCCVLALTLMCRIAIADAPEGARGAGFTFAKRAIAPTLKDPSSANFDWDSVQVEGVLSAAAVGDPDGEIVFVAGVVRAKNSFNAVVPSQWRVVMYHADDKYEPIVVTNDDAFVLKTDRGEMFLNAALNEKQKKRDAERAAAAEHAEHRKAAKAEAARLKKANDAGRKAGAEAVSRFGRNVKTVPDSLVEKNARSALRESGITSAGESAQFVDGFTAVVNDARNAGK